MNWQVTVRAPINIALIKYWGKRDQDEIIPMNPSISMTLSSTYIGSTTCITAGVDITETTLSIDDTPYPLTSRIERVIEKARTFAAACSLNLQATCEKGTCPPLNCHFRIVSRNDVPTASGLASSASGIAALAMCLIKLFHLDAHFSMQELSQIARVGSGSACRSMFGGFVLWDGLCSTPMASATVDERLGKGIKVLVLAQKHVPKKMVSSTRGMQDTVATSSLYKHRIDYIVPARIDRLRALISGDLLASSAWDDFVRLVCQDSNQFHALCLDTYPPLFYLNEVSRHVIHFVTLLNDFIETSSSSSSSSSPLLGPVAYTFDAGPHPVLIFQRQDEATLLALLDRYFLIEYVPHVDAGPTNGHGHGHLDPSLTAIFDACPLFQAEAPRTSFTGYRCHLDDKGPTLVSQE